MSITPEAILDIISEEAGVDRAALQPDATLESLGIASLDVVSIIFTLEDRFGLIVETSDLSEAKTLQDLLDVVMAKSAEA